MLSPWASIRRSAPPPVTRESTPSSSGVTRANCRARGLDDPGHFVLEGVLVISAGLTLTAFVIWFLFIAGANPLPLGISV